MAVIGVKEPKLIPSSLELPITITNPKIAAKTTQASIKSVYMTTTAVCGSRMETETSDYWTTGTGVESNGHEVVEEEEDNIVMVVEEDGDGEDAIVHTVEDEIIEGATGETLIETSEFAT